MRKVIYAINVSLDGFMEGPDGDLNWSMPDPALHQHFNDLESQEIDLALYGRGLYENMAGFWPTADQDPSTPPVVTEYARIWRSQRRIVFSTTLKEAPWAEKIVRDHVVEEVQRLKEQDGRLISVGGAGLAASLARMNLIDEYWLYFHPVILGGGKPLIGPLPKKTNLALVETRTFGNGVLMARYRKG